ncbi:MAG: aldo/keto reductase, partial [Pseudomonadota bacterium]
MKAFELPRIGFGCWDDVAQLVKDGDGLPLPPDATRDNASIAILKSAIEAGYRHFDTAEMYGAGHSETMLGSALQGCQRDEFLVTTKVNPENLAYTDLLAACDRSLTRLQLSY